MSRRLWLWPVYFLLLLGVTVAGAEFIASYSVPSWPARDLRPIPMAPMQANAAKAVSDTIEVNYNDWAVKDRPRSITRPSDIRFRSVLVGDSFLEGSYQVPPVAALIERRWADQGRTGMEAINLGINATSPRHYYYRIKKVALQLEPDVIVVFVYAGNDFIADRLDAFAVPPLVEELPLPSILGTVAPRTTWLLANRLGLLEIARGNKDIPDESALLNQWAEQPSAERLDRVVRHMKKYYYPELGEDTIREILSRGSSGFAAATTKRGVDREYLAGWLLSSIISWETGRWDMPRNAEEADRMVGDSLVDETLSWLVGAERIAEAKGVQLIVALVPVGVVDPSYVEFWRPWPNYFSYSMSADVRHRRLAAALRQRGTQLIDLREALNGVRGTYRVTDGHWTLLGTRIVAERVSNELLAVRERLVDGKRVDD
jgi:acetyltransferase AlgX (SGNH hydrolase-like protein)